ncbi:hypothetical protein IVU49_10305 [Salmonella enterica subsp. enterica serovar Worthington]|nr:hypothetical protein [Salmonella enterica subsp. enterica serovar Worthington]
MAGYGARAHSFSGVTGAYLLGRLEWRQKLGLAFNEMVRCGEVSAPIVIGRDHRIPVLSPALTVKPKRCATVPTRFPTGRC